MTPPLPPQSLKVRLCQLQKRCHRKQEQWWQWEHRVTDQKDTDSCNVSPIGGMGVGAGLGAAVSSIGIAPRPPLISSW